MNRIQSIHISYTYQKLDNLNTKNILPKRFEIQIPWLPFRALAYLSVKLGSDNKCENTSLTLKDYINVSFFFPPSLQNWNQGIPYRDKKLVIFGLLLSGSASGGGNTWKSVQSFSLETWRLLDIVGCRRC